MHHRSEVFTVVPEYSIGCFLFYDSLYFGLKRYGGHMPNMFRRVAKTAG